MKLELLEVYRDEENRRVSLELIIAATSEEKENGKVCVQAPRFAQPFSCTEICVKNLNPGERIKEVLRYECVCGGRFVFYAWEKGNELATLSRIVVSFKGAGVYSGNTHSHSTYSDGESTLEENRCAMMENGHSFIYATDHNTMAHYKELLQYAPIGVEENFLHIPGWEYTTKYGHSIPYRSSHTYDAEKIPERGNLAAWQEYVDAMNHEGALVFLAHPYEAPRFEFGENVLMNIRGIVGVEAWNGYNFHALDYQNRKNFEVWDKLNRKGGHHYVATACSDAHTRDGQSSPFIKGYLPRLTRENVEEMLAKGSFFGSNGPEVTFSIGGAGMGETCIAGEGRVFMQIEAFDPLGNIEVITVYKGFVDGEYSEKANTKKDYEFYPLSEVEKRNCVIDLFLDVAPGEFYRVEVRTAIGVVAYMSNPNRIEKGFAFTNPIWIGKQEDTGYAFKNSTCCV